MFVIMGMVGKLTGAEDQICGTLTLNLTISLKTYSATMGFVVVVAARMISKSNSTLSSSPNAPKYP